MRTSIIMAGGTFALIAAGIMAPVAAASSTVDSSAADVVAELSRQGYSVQINGSVDEPLSRCTVTAIHGMSASPGTAYVDVDCPTGG